MIFNVADPPYKNKKLRLAVAHAINRKEIVDGAYFGLGELAHHSGFQGVTPGSLTRRLSRDGL